MPAASLKSVRYFARNAESGSETPEQLQIRPCQISREETASVPMRQPGQTDPQRLLYRAKQKASSRAAQQRASVSCCY